MRGHLSSLQFRLISGKLIKTTIKFLENNEYFSLWKRFDSYVRGLGGRHYERCFEISTQTPHYIIHWIMNACENRVAGAKYNEEIKEDEKGALYSYALKMRAALSWGFAHDFRCGHQEYKNRGEAKWDGNPSLAYEVGKYMVSLQRRKVSYITKNLGNFRGILTVSRSELERSLQALRQ